MLVQDINYDLLFCRATNLYNSLGGCLSLEIEEAADVYFEEDQTILSCGDFIGYNPVTLKVTFAKPAIFFKKQRDSRAFSLITYIDSKEYAITFDPKSKSLVFQPYNPDDENQILESDDSRRSNFASLGTNLINEFN